jgi:septal ring factor EnvC (AmiA/AmiB activator)
MYGDTEVMRRRAAQLREQGVDIRAMADRLVARTEAVGWTGRAAEALSQRIRERAAHLRDVASRHDGAAESLETHLLEVDRLKEAIAAAERRAGHLAADAPASDRVAAFTPPPAGHKDWLAVDLPGA